MTVQALVGAWVQEALGEANRRNAHERALRAVEEIVELAQACHVSAETLHRLVDYVFARPVGDPTQEIGGSMVTLYAAAEALGIDADAAFMTEFKRILRPEIIERVRRRDAEKRESGVGGIEK